MRWPNCSEFKEIQTLINETGNENKRDYYICHKVPNTTMRRKEVLENITKIKSLKEPLAQKNKLMTVYNTREVEKSVSRRRI